MRPASGSQPLGPMGRPTARPSGAISTGRLTQRPAERMRSQPLPAGPSQPRRLQLSALIDDRIEGLSARERQRAWLVNTVALAQALITVMVAPGYGISSVNLPMLVTLGVGLFFCLVAFLFNQWRRELRVAVYLLIGGGALATSAQVFVAALLTHDGAHTAQAALFFLPLILEAGLFLTPELTLTVASVASVVTASAILLGLALASDSSSQLSESYLVMVYTLGLEVFIGYLAWRLAQFIYETVKKSQADEDLQFSRAQLSVTEQQISGQRRQLLQDIAVIQMAVSSALSQEYDTGIENVSGDIASLASTVNLLIQQLRSTNELERKVQRMESHAVTLVEMAGRIGSGAGALQRSEAPSDTALYSVAVALQQAHTLVLMRYERLQEAAATVAASLGQARVSFDSTAQESIKAEQFAGSLDALAASLMAIAQRQTELLAQARRALALALPKQLIQGELADGSLREPSTNSDLAGLGADIGVLRPGLTGVYDTLTPIGEDDDAKIPPMTTPLRALNALASEMHAEQTSGTESGSHGELPAGLADAWLLLTNLAAQTADEARIASNLSFDLGVLGRHVRQTGQGIARINQLLDVTERDIDRMHQVAGGASVESLADPHPSLPMAGRPAASSSGRHAPPPTRPLGDDDLVFGETGAASVVTPPPIETTQSSVAAPGSLRIASLIDADALMSQGPTTPPTPNAELRSDSTGDPDLR